jgi:ABC-2 type transport system permease protein
MTTALLYDGTAMLGRHLQRIRHAPAILVMTQTMPIVFLLFFGYVFGSALAMPGADYRAFLVPGMLVATAANGIMTGMFTADVVTTAAGLVPLLLVGLAMGWRIEGGALEAAGGFGLLLLFRFATTWVGILLGLLSRSEEAAGQLGGATFMLPLLSNAYIPTAGFPGWVRVLAEWNPISAVATAVRDLFGNAPVPGGSSWPVAHPVAGSLAWCAVLLTVCVPLAVRRYTTGGR